MYVFRSAASLILTLAAAGVHAGESEIVAGTSDALDRAIVSGDRELAAASYCDEFVLTTSSATRKSKAEMLQEVGAPDLRFEINQTTDVQVRVVGDSAVLTGRLHQKGEYRGQSFDYRFLVTDTWTRGCGEGWRLLAGHATRLPEAAPAAN